ncbi:MAG: hypothetical protein IBX43_03125 [Campylobacterales bacterium]|nr:hypothetical protein [Campylobacterales bacterium]
MLRCLLLVLFATLHLAAAPAFQEVRDFKQEDGSSFSARLQGDEYLNWIETSDEEILLFNKQSKQYEYATIKEGKLLPSGQKFAPASQNKKSAPLGKSIQKKELLELWKKKRRDAHENRRPE